MPISMQWLGHATWLIESDGRRLLIDPFLNDSPTSPVKAEDVDADVILVSHGHFDHVSDVASIARRNGSQVIANFEVADWFAKNHNLENTVGMNIGGNFKTDLFSVKMTHAIHSSQLPDGSYGGSPAGFLLSLGDKTIYFACDTSLFSDMQLIGKAGVDVAVLPIGDLFTMGPADSIEAIKLIQPKQVLPSHFGTWPPIEQDAEAWAEQVRKQTEAEPIVLSPGDSHAC
ncbi:MAG: metal-dependent hydrolase [Planctomycetota bacterium]|nr:metal-dependent hydrolase [Planctomycetota bacterium]